ncbi:MAG: hypothetical protein A2V98_18690 [Planctomycetes bacterium RBG_16_64_12]|nr:MAG: hypothetical protein A2V98_18690 [Planctomycetes bacterium RBG_16_64_12]
MWRRCLLVFFAWVIVFGLVLPASVWAGHPFRFARKPAPEPRFYPEYVREYDPYGAGVGLGVPTYNWGYFGARHGPSCTSHQGYYGDYFQWSFRPGY